MAQAEWYCHECGTFGGGPPNHMTEAEHIDAEHDGGLAQIESATSYKRNR